MAFAKKQQAAPQISAARLATIAGGGVAVAEEPSAAQEPLMRRELQPDLSRIRPRGTLETPEQRKKRMAAKTINFTMTFLARIIIMGAVGFLIHESWQGTGVIHRGYAMAMFAMVADFGRVTIKAMEPGTK